MRHAEMLNENERNFTFRCSVFCWVFCELRDVSANFVIKGFLSKGTKSKTLTAKNAEEIAVNKNYRPNFVSKNFAIRSRASLVSGSW